MATVARSKGQSRIPLNLGTGDVGLVLWLPSSTGRARDIPNPSGSIGGSLREGFFQPPRPASGVPQAGHAAPCPSGLDRGFSSSQGKHRAPYLRRGMELPQRECEAHHPLWESRESVKEGQGLPQSLREDGK